MLPSGDNAPQNLNEILARLQICTSVAARDAGKWCALSDADALRQTVLAKVASNSGLVFQVSGCLAAWHFRRKTAVASAMVSGSQRLPCDTRECVRYANEKALSRRALRLPDPGDEPPKITRVSPEFWALVANPFTFSVCRLQEWHRAIRLDWPGNLVGTLKSGPVRHPGLEAESFALVHCQRHTAWCVRPDVRKASAALAGVAGLRVRGQAQEKMRKLLKE